MDNRCHAKILATGHAAYPVCRGGLANLLGVARAPDLICDLLEKGRIGPNTLKGRPLTFPEGGSVLQLVEQLRMAQVPMAIINDKSEVLTGVITSTDLLETILGERPAAMKRRESSGNRTRIWDP